MGFEQVNTFKNIIQDLDYSLRPSDSLELVLNARFITKDGQTYIATNVDGNRNEFKLSDGFVPLGKCEYRGILYIASFNENTSETEIGCFPSPDFVAGTTTFDREYRPLYNLTDAGGRVNMTSDKFNSDKLHQFDMLPRRDYDDSVNLYICDFKNPNMVVNTGFYQAGSSIGALSDRIYTESDFGAEISQIVSSDALSKIVFDRIIGGVGDGLKHGNYILGLRYLTSSLDPTYTICHSSPIQLSNASIGSDGNVIEGNAVIGGTGVDDLSPANEGSQKGIRITIENISSSYEYIQIILIRYYSSDDGSLITDVNLIDVNYSISDVIANGINITGDENLLPYTMAEVITPQPIETICKSQCQIDNRWWGANWKVFASNKENLEWLSSLIKPGYVKKLISDDAYKHPENVFDYVGYFRGEINPLQIVWVFNDGSESQAYRIKGADDFHVGSKTYSILQPGDADFNRAGLYRFPGQKKEPLFDVGSTDKVVVLGLTFDFTDAINDPLWSSISSYVKGFYFTRSERKENLKYQGIALHCPRGYELTFSDVDYNDACIPQWNKLPSVEYYLKHKWTGAWREEFTFYENDAAGVDRYLGIFSPDYLFEHFTDIAELGNHLVSQGNYIWGGESVSECTFPYGNLIYCTENPPVPSSSYQDTDHIKMYQVGPGEVSPNNNQIPGKWFVNKAYDIWTDDTRNLYKAEKDLSGVAHPEPKWYRRCNRNVITTKYIGLYLTDAMTSQSYHQHLVNIYRDFNPEEKLNIGQIENIGYLNDGLCYRICDTRELSSVSLIEPSVECWRGDCFVQRTYIKQSTWFHSKFRDTAIHPDGKSTKYTELAEGVKTKIGFYGGVWDAGSWASECDHGKYEHGVVMGIVSENRINTAMRHVKDAHEFYPYVVSGLSDVATSIWCVYPNDDNVLNSDGSSSLPGTGIEAFVQNIGFNEVLDNNAKSVEDISIPLEQGCFPCRIRYSDKHIEGSFIDGYRTIAYNNKKDYESRYGDMNVIRNVLGYLVSVQDRVISQHYINEKQVLQDPEAQDIVIGVGDILAEKARKMSTFGSSHQWSVEVGEKAMYGVDFNERILWSVGLTTNKDGKTFMASQNLSKSKLIQRWVYDLISLYSVDDVSDVTNKFPDNPIGLNKGIVVGYDKRNSDVLYTFLNSKEISGLLTYENLVLLQIKLTDVTGDLSNKYEAGDYIEFYYDSGGGDYYVSGVVLTVESLYIVVQLTISMAEILNKFPEGSDVTIIYNLSKTIAFNEDIDAFTSEYSFTPPMYFNINNDFFSSHILLNDLGTDMYIHDKGAVPSDDNKQTFYGHLYKFVLQWVVNGITGQGNLSSYTKAYDAMQIESDKTDFYKIVYEGQTQMSEHFPFVQPISFWLDPEYKERRWYVPINRQTDVEEESYDIESQARDTWLKVKLEYFSEVATFVKNIKTFFRVSKS